MAQPPAGAPGPDGQLPARNEIAPIGDIWVLQFTQILGRIGGAIGTAVGIGVGAATAAVVPPGAAADGPSPAGVGGATRAPHWVQNALSGARALPHWVQVAAAMVDTGGFPQLSLLAAARPVGNNCKGACHAPLGVSVEAAFAFFFGLALGFSLTIPPGPMNALIAAQAVHSYRTGVVTGLGAMSADLVLAVLVYAFRSEIDLNPVLRWVYLVGAVVMLFFGVRVLTRRAVPASNAPAGIRTYSQGVLLGITNPFQIVWWLTAGLAFAYLGGLILFVGLFAAVVVWVVSFPYALHLGTRGRPRAAQVVGYVSAAIMFGFAVYFAILAA